MDEELAVVKLFKFDPATDRKSRYDTYEVPYKDWAVLDVLNYVYEKHDPNLSFRSGCKVGKCTCCLVSCNGKTVFSCKKLAEKEMVIEPHPKFEVIKDLVVNFDLPKKRRAAN